ncbi:hypothetical protein L3Y34_016939 [Caenorhabditis briggsae]|uniref:RFX-type winged-helix domain-containing protein n=1 Tax=Caenorhabditis briggsae TaxID=6238 RepID=A0AAE9DH06_CAEBR|nr:hypothetical protein L3Y34_016939 [Caenorhabditis briggsae]
MERVCLVVKGASEHNGIRPGELQKKPDGKGNTMTEEKKIAPTQSSKKRKGLDIDALWRKKLKDVENHQSPDDQKTLESEGTSSKGFTPSKKDPEDVKKELGSPSELEKEKDEKVTTPSPPPKEDTPPVSRSTRSSRKKTEAEKKKMELDDVKPNLKLLKKGLPFTCQNLDDQSEEMEVIHQNVDGGDSRDGQYQYSGYNHAVTPNGQNYQLYGADTSYSQYYPYTNNLQQSPQDTSGAYLVPNAAQSPVSIEDQDTQLLPNNQRASPATIGWLFENYEIAEGSSLPRCQLYDHYRKHCEEHRMDPVNAASFGKLIRSVFQNLKTRRLGTRGNSKYHYYGIKMKDNSPLHLAPNTIHPECFVPPLQQMGVQRNGGNLGGGGGGDVYVDTINQVAAVKYVDMNGGHRKRSKRGHSSTSSSDDRDSASPALGVPTHQTIVNRTNELGVSIPPQQIGFQPNATPAVPYIFTDQDRKGMGKAQMPNVQFTDKAGLLSTISEISKINPNGVFRKLGLNEGHITKLIEEYDRMCYDVLAMVKSLEFSKIEEMWSSFWSGGCGIKHDVLMALCTLDKIQDHIIEVDLNLYQTMVDVLIPNVLLSELSAGMTQSCRTFGKNIDVYLRKALISGNLNETFIKKKIQAIKYMQQGLKRYTSLNHLAHAARGVLQKDELCQQMYQDYIKVDIMAVHQQAGWICNCDSVMVQHVNNAFKENLQKMKPMSVWAEWLESIVDQVLAKYHDKPSNMVSNVGKQFLLNWSFYTSMIIRELTLRSATSFGSFTLIRLLADDYMYHLIATKIARASNQPLITVTRQDKDWPLAKEAKEYIVPPADDHDDDLNVN